MGEAKSRKDEIDDIKGSSTCKIIYFDSVHNICKAYEIHTASVNMTDKQECLVELLGAGRAYKHDEVSNYTEEYLMPIFANHAACLLKHYHGDLKPNKHYALQVGELADGRFGPIQSGELPESEFRKLLGAPVQ